MGIEARPLTLLVTLLRGMALRSVSRARLSFSKSSLMYVGFSGWSQKEG